MIRKGRGEWRTTGNTDPEASYENRLKDREKWGAKTEAGVGWGGKV